MCFGSEPLSLNKLQMAEMESLTADRGGYNMYTYPRLPIPKEEGTVRM